MSEAIEYTIPYIIHALPLFFKMIIAAFILYIIGIQIKIAIANVHFTIHLTTINKLICLAFTLSLLTDSIYFAVDSLSLDDYIERKRQATTIYEDYYVNPSTATINCPDQPKNLIYLYVESMETTYASTEDDRMQDINYIPRLTQLANENISFSDTELLGQCHLV